eukprot:g1516.t1
MDVKGRPSPISIPRMVSDPAEQEGEDDGAGGRPSLVSHEQLLTQRSLEMISEAARRRRSAAHSADPVSELFSEIPVYRQTSGGAAKGAVDAPDFQRVELGPPPAVDGVDEVQREVQDVCRRLQRARALRAKWLGFFEAPAPNWGGLSPAMYPDPRLTANAAPEMPCTPGRPRRHRPELAYAPFARDSEEDVPAAATDRAYWWVDGVMQVVSSSGGGGGGGGDGGGGGGEQGGSVLFSAPTAREYYLDLFEVQRIVEHGPTKSFAFRQLRLLEARFTLHEMLNAETEYAEQKQVPHRDFYNVRKVDTHIHHSACMNQKHLLRFIKSKLRHHSADTVDVSAGGEEMSLLDVFQSLGLTAYDLNLDTLDMSANDTFHRFDRFNKKYNPCGASQLRTVFLKTDNYIKGRYLAELTREVQQDLRQSKYQMAEWRISVYGRKADEWGKLARWVVDHRLGCAQVRWLIQVPRLYSVYRRMGLISSFQDMLENIFAPLFAVTRDPRADPALHLLLKAVVGFDCVDDESKPEVLHSEAAALELPAPAQWTSETDPPYSYWLYYLRANLLVLNHFRRERGFSTLELRPHAGEAGHVNHLASAYLASDKINHGIMLRKSSGLQYLYYLDQVGIALSPISNNKLFLVAAAAGCAPRPLSRTIARCSSSSSCRTELRASSARSTVLSFHTCAATLYSSSSGSAVMCSMSGSSVDSETFMPILK